MITRNKSNKYKSSGRIFSIVASLLFGIFILSFSSAYAQTSVRKPIIGISSYVDGTTSKVGMTYIESVRKAGGCPVVIPLTTDIAQLESVLQMLDGLVMTGGEDISPFYFSEEPHRNLGEVVPDRDIYDMELIKRAIEKKLPLLAICRGEQILNVALGGDLYQDIPSQVSNAIQHSQKAPRDYGSHTIKVSKNSLLHSLLSNSLDANNSIRVNSFHHQAIRKVAPSLTVVATAPDGVVEAVESKDGLILGVQFHPEGFVYYGNNSFLPIFEWLVKKAASK